MELDINNLLNSKYNIAILNFLKNTQYCDLVKLFNKYGIFGFDIPNFLTELEQILEKLELTNNKECE